MLYIYNPSSVFIFTQLQLHVNTQWLCEIVLCNACMVAKQRWHQNSMVFHSSYVLLVKKTKLWQRPGVTNLKPYHLRLHLVQPSLWYFQKTTNPNSFVPTPSLIAKQQSKQTTSPKAPPTFMVQFNQSSEMIWTE